MTDFDHSLPGVSYLIDAPSKWVLFLPQSVVEKIVEQNDYERGIEQSVATKFGGDK